MFEQDRFGQSENQEIDFDKMQGLLPAIVQDADNGDVLMLGFMNREAFEQDTAGRVCHILQPHSQPALDQGRDFRQPAGSRVGRDRLRSRHGPAARCEWRAKAWFATKGTRSCFTKPLPLSQPAAQSEGSLP